MASHRVGNVVNVCQLVIMAKCYKMQQIIKHKFPVHDIFVFTGLGEVAESLVNDDSLSAADFLDDQIVSPDVGTSEQFVCSKDCLTNPKTVDCNEFKTPLTSRYKHKISDTPCLFSQDESVNHTPTSSEWIVFVQKYMYTV